MKNNIWWWLSDNYEYVAAGLLMVGFSVFVAAMLAAVGVIGI